MYALSVSFLSRSEFVIKVGPKKFYHLKKRKVVLIKDIIHFYWPLPQFSVVAELSVACD